MAKPAARIVRSTIVLLAPYLLFWLWGAVLLAAPDRDGPLLALVLAAPLGGFLVGMIEAFQLFRLKIRLVPTFLLSALCGAVLGTANFLLFNYFVLMEIASNIG